jgi:hypothetical protein
MIDGGRDGSIDAEARGMLDPRDRIAHVQRTGISVIDHRRRARDARRGSGAIAIAGLVAVTEVAV